MHLQQRLVWYLRQSSSCPEQHLKLVSVRKKVLFGLEEIVVYSFQQVVYCGTRVG